MAQTVNAVLGVKVAPGKSESECLTAHLATKQVLLVLDNAEHLLAGCAELVDTLLRACPRCFHPGHEPGSAAASAASKPIACPRWPFPMRSKR